MLKKKKNEKKNPDHYYSTMSEVTYDIDLPRRPYLAVNSEISAKINNTYI